MNKARYWNTCCAFLKKGYFAEKDLLAVKEFLSIKIKGENLDIGGGWHSYCQNKAVIDLSEKSLKRNTNPYKVNFDLDSLCSNTHLPFKQSSFDSATLIFVLQYLKHPRELFLNLESALKPNGKVYIINGNGYSATYVDKFMPSNNEDIYQELSKFGYPLKKENIPFTEEENIFQSIEMFLT